MGAAARLVAAFVLAAGLPMLSGPMALAQTAAAPDFKSPILTIDQDRFFNQSLWGKRVASEIETASANLAAENRGIEADLVAEERGMTDRRPAMNPDEFRKLADAFDAKVVAIRAAQDKKTHVLSLRHDEERQKFLQAVLPYIGALLRERGAVAILDNRTVFIAADAIDVTEALTAEVDARVGAGPDLPAEPAQPGAVAPGTTGGDGATAPAGGTAPGGTPPQP